MKTHLSKPVRTKAEYTRDYKQQALELWRNSGRSAAESGDGVGDSPSAPLSLGAD
ncbi:MAG: hypothetical protein M3Y80_09695 [Verrucomicrobiota bacterium]|nr:hypothetical protein [Verrucomicrobiota bacterium]